MRINFTANEIASLTHRLDVPDAIADYMESMGHGTIEDSEMVCELIRAGGICDLSAAMNHSEYLTRRIMVDLVDGSTLPACVDTEFDGQPGHATRKAREVGILRRAAAKIEQAFGMDSGSIIVPMD
jgi:hypothetical protein